MVVRNRGTNSFLPHIKHSLFLLSPLLCLSWHTTASWSNNTPDSLAYPTGWRQNQTSERKQCQTTFLGLSELCEAAFRLLYSTRLFAAALQRAAAAHERIATPCWGLKTPGVSTPKITFRVILQRAPGAAVVGSAELRCLQPGCLGPPLPPHAAIPAPPHGAPQAAPPLGAPQPPSGVAAAPGGQPLPWSRFYLASSPSTRPTAAWGRHRPAASGPAAPAGPGGLRPPAAGTARSPTTWLTPPLRLPSPSLPAAPLMRSPGRREPPPPPRLPATVW